MPTYQYACTACDERLEVVQRFTDDPLTECPKCTSQLRKVFSPVGIVFKGSGFYRTDSRSKVKDGQNGQGGKEGKTPETGRSSPGTSNAQGKSSAKSAATAPVKAENAA